MKMRKLVVWPFLISMITNGCLCQSGLPRVISVKVTVEDGRRCLTACAHDRGQSEVAERDE